MGPSNTSYIGFGMLGKALCYTCMLLLHMAIGYLSAEAAGPWSLQVRLDES